MYLCSDGHDEVCHEVYLCPVCDVQEDMQTQLNDAETEIKDLKSQIESLKED